MSKPVFKLFPLLRFDESPGEFEGLEDGRNHLLYRVFFWIGTAFIGFFALVNFLQERMMLATMLGSVLAGVVVVNYYVAKTSNLMVAGFFYTAALIPLVWFLIWHGGVESTGLLWAYPITIIIISILGYIYGFFAAVILFVGAASLMLLGFPLAPQMDYEETFKLRFLATLFALGGLTWGIELSRAKAFGYMRKFNARLEKVSMTDQLTGLLNRRGLEDMFEAEVNRFKRMGETFSMLMIDVDDFKAINDEYGHIVGDDILQQLAWLMQDEIRGMDTIGRWGGEEFIILLSQADAEDAAQAAEKLRIKVESHRGFEQHETKPLTVSIGITTYHPGAELLEMTDIADHALYTAKQAGKNRVYSLQYSEVKLSAPTEQA